MPSKAGNMVSALHQAIAQVCPIDGVCIAEPDDKTTWRIDYAPLANADQQTAAQAVLTAFIYTPLITVVTSVLLGRLTDAEYTAIMQTASAQLSVGNGQLARWLDMARIAVGGVNLNDPTTIAAKDALIAAGILTPDRAAAIFVQ